MHTSRPVLLFLACLVLPAGCLDSPDAGPDPGEIEQALDLPTPSCPPTTPSITGVNVTVPTPGALMIRGTGTGAVHYMTGNLIDFAVTLPSCVWISSVRLGSSVLGTTSGGLDGPDTWYEVLSDSPLHDGGHRVTLRLHLANTAWGGTGEVRLTASGTLSTITVSRDFTLVRVKEIHPADVEARFSMSETEIKNGMVAAMYADFGDDGEFYDPDAGTLYAPDYAATVLDIEPAGITFRQAFHLEVDYWCDPYVEVTGRFHLEHVERASPQFDEINVVWDQGPHVDADTDFYCEYAPIVVQWIIAYFAERRAEAEVRDRMGEAIDGMFADAGCGTICANEITGFDLLHDELRVRMTPRLDEDDPIWPAVVIEVPYNTNHIQSPVTYGYGLAANENAMVVGSGRVDVCTAAGTASPPACATASVTPTGLFPWSNAPVPPDHEVSPPVVIYYEERDHARGALIGLDRDVYSLPHTGALPASMVARRGWSRGASATVSVASPCRITTTSSGQRVAFGANDYRSPSNNEYGSGTYRITMAFPPNLGEASVIAACP